VHLPKGTRLLSRREAALALGISVDTLARLLSNQELKAIRIGRSVLIPETELSNLIERELDVQSDETQPGEPEIRTEKEDGDV
jgi:excisionase family DNA binding protein